MRNGPWLPRCNSAGVSTELGMRPAFRSDVSDRVGFLGDLQGSWGCVRPEFPNLQLMWGHAHEVSELRLSLPFQFRVSGAGLLRPECHGEVSAARCRRDSRASLCRDACRLGAAFVLFLPAHRAA